MKEKDVHTVSIKGMMHKACARVWSCMRTHVQMYIKKLQSLVK